METNPNSSFTIWYVTDEKAGHLNQIKGLIKALIGQIKNSNHDIEIKTQKIVKDQIYSGFWSFLLRFAGKKPNFLLSKPNVVLGCGHQTHLSLIALSRAYKIPTVVMMKPSLPRFFFNYIVAPEHDGLQSSARVFNTQGALNRIENNDKIENTGLILLGGISRHFVWDSNRIFDQLKKLLEREKSTSWTLTTSPRTPSNFLDELEEFQNKNNFNFSLFPYDMCPENWLQETLPSIENVWISPDSISMIYESLTSGANVGLFDLNRHVTRVSKQIDKLINKHQVTPFKDWIINSKMETNSRAFNEAERVAKWLLDDLL